MVSVSCLPLPHFDRWCWLWWDWATALIGHWCHHKYWPLHTAYNTKLHKPNNAIYLIDDERHLISMPYYYFNWFIPYPRPAAFLPGPLYIYDETHLLFTAALNYCIIIIYMPQVTWWCYFEILHTCSQLIDYATYLYLIIFKRFDAFLTYVDYRIEMQCKEKCLNEK